MKKGVLISLLSLYLAGCSTVTIHPDNMPKLNNKPDYEESKDFFLYGVIGDRRVDVDVICGDKGVRQMQTQATVTDSFLTIITLSLYAPHSVKVWCNK